MFADPVHKVKFQKIDQFLVAFILFYGCEKWTLLVERKKKGILAFETKCLRKLLRILEHELVS